MVSFYSSFYLVSQTRIMKSPTDQSIKQALAKMLPEKITYKIDKLWHHNQYISMYGWIEVPDTKLLQICWEIEEGLTESQLGYEYPARLIGACSETASKTQDRCSTANAHATWQQRTIALAQVKGVEII